MYVCVCVHVFMYTAVNISARFGCVSCQEGEKKMGLEPCGSKSVAMPSFSSAIAKADAMFTRGFAGVKLL